MTDGDEGRNLFFERVFSTDGLTYGHYWDIRSASARQKLIATKLEQKTLTLLTTVKSKKRSIILIMHILKFSYQANRSQAVIYLKLLVNNAFIENWTVFIVSSISKIKAKEMNHDLIVHFITFIQCYINCNIKINGS